MDRGTAHRLGRVLKVLGWVLYLVWVLLTVTFWTTKGLGAVPWIGLGVLFLVIQPVTWAGNRLTRDASEVGPG